MKESSVTRTDPVCRSGTGSVAEGNRGNEAIDPGSDVFLGSCGSTSDGPDEDIPNVGTANEETEK